MTTFQLTDPADASRMFNVEVWYPLGGATGPLAFLETDGCGPNTIPVDDAHAASRTLAVAFFDHALRGLNDDHGYLDPARGVMNVKLH